MLNTIVIGFEAAWIQDTELKPHFMRIEAVFTCLYVAELVIRLRSRGFRNYFITDGDIGWNYFDFAITSVGVADTLLQFTGQGGGSGASAGRLFRVLRILRLFRALRFLKELDMVLAVAAKATMKLLALVMVVNIVSAIVTTNILWDAPDPDVAEDFRDLFASMYTMFQLMTLDNWINTVDRILKVKPGMFFFFMGFVFFGSIALMSLVPAIFIELNMTAREKEKAKEQSARQKANSVMKRRMLRHLFRLVDKDGNGWADIAEMQVLLDDPNLARSLGRHGNADIAEDLLDMKLGVYMLLESKLEEYSPEEEWKAKVTEEEFIRGVNKAWGDVDQPMLRRGITATRQRVHNFSLMLGDELEQLRQTVSEMRNPWSAPRQLSVEDQRAIKQSCAKAVKSQVDLMLESFERQSSTALSRHISAATALSTAGTALSRPLSPVHRTALITPQPLQGQPAPTHDPEDLRELAQCAHQLIRAPDEDADSDAESDAEEAKAVSEPDDWSSSKQFQHVTGAVIMLNTIVIGFEAAWIQDTELKPHFMRIEAVFTCLYVAELVIRLRSRGFRNYFITDGDIGWNYFDFAITSVGVADTLLQFTGQGGGSGASAGRLFRVLRILRLFRALRFLKELDMVLAVAAKATMKLLALVMVVNIVSAIVTTNILWDAPDPDVAEDFRDLFASMYTMFQLMTLDNWINTVDRILKVKPGMFFFFMGFVFFGSIALMSLVPAIFIELNMTAREKEKAKEQSARQKANSVMKRRMLRHLFRLVDKDGNGWADIAEMQVLLDDPNLARSLGRHGNADIAEDLLDMKLGVYMLLESKLEEYSPEEEWKAKVTEEEFIRGVNKAWGDVDQPMLRRGITATRQKLHFLSRAAADELAQVRRDLKQLGNAGFSSMPMIRQMSVQDQNLIEQSMNRAVRTEVEAMREQLSKLLKEARESSQVAQEAELLQPAPTAETDGLPPPAWAPAAGFGCWQRGATMSEYDTDSSGG